MSASSATRLREKVNLDGLWQRMGLATASAADDVGLAPNIARVPDPLEPSGWSDDSERREALTLLQTRNEPITLALLLDHGVRQPGQTIYELQLAGYRIDRLPAGYLLSPGDRPAASPRPKAKPEASSEAALQVKPEPAPEASRGSEMVTGAEVKPAQKKRPAPKKKPARKTTAAQRPNPVPKAKPEPKGEATEAAVHAESVSGRAR